MPLRLSQYSAPTAEPIHLTAAKLHLRLAADAVGAVAYTAEDSQLSMMIASVRSVAEVETWKAIVLQTWDLYLDEWPAVDEIRLPWPPLMAVVLVQYTEASGTVSTFAATEYEVDTDSTPGRIVLGYEKSWPTATLAPKNPIRIRFKCGYVVPFSVAYTTDTVTALNHPFADGDVVRLSVSGGVLPEPLAVMTDYYVRDVSGDTMKLAATSGGAAINLTTAGSGTLFIGEIPASTVIGMKLVLSDLYEERSDTVIGKFSGDGPAQLPRGASHHFAMDSAREF